LAIDSDSCLAIELSTTAPGCVGGNGVGVGGSGVDVEVGSGVGVDDGNGIEVGSGVEVGSRVGVEVETGSGVGVEVDPIVGADDALKDDIYTTKVKKVSDTKIRAMSASQNHRRKR
jgi:hypothetical protein